MVVSMTIQNADNALLSAIKSVCKLHPSAKVSIKKQNSLADELKAEQAEILAEYEKGMYRRLDEDPDGVAAMRRIRETGALDEEAETALKAALTAYTQEFIKKRNR